MSIEKRNRKFAFAGTLLFHAFLLLVFILLALRTPLPLPGEEGVEVNLGYTDVGSLHKQKPPSQPVPAPAPRSEPLQQNEELATQTAEETVALPEKKEEKKETKPQPEKPKPEIKPEPEPEPDPEPEPPKVDPRALYRGRTQETQTGQGEGNTGQAGDQGRPDGTPEGTSHQGSGGAGDGISYNLSGRSATHLPKPDYLSREQGRVVVTVWVDKNGKVVRASPGAQGTTTTDPALRKAAEEAALQARFSASPNAPEEQKGAITYIFLRQN